MATLTGVPLIQGVDVAPTAMTAIYTVPTTVSRVRVDNISFTNYTAAGVQITVEIIESGGSAGNTKKVVDDVTIPAHETYEPSSVLHGLSVGDSIQASASSANAINVRATGTTFTST